MADVTPEVLEISGKVCLASDAIALQREMERWRRVAIYLADCHAASAEGVLGRKSGSKSEKRRMRSICERALSYLQGNDPGYQACTATAVIDRLKDRIGEQTP